MDTNSLAIALSNVYAAAYSGTMQRERVFVSETDAKMNAEAAVKHFTSILRSNRFELPIDNNQNKRF